MQEAAEDLVRLQELLDRSYETAGAHLRSIITPERRLTAEALPGRLTGMCLLVVCTTTADGRPIAGPVDGIFCRGAFHFGSSAESVRFRHIRRGSAGERCLASGTTKNIRTSGRPVLMAPRMSRSRPDIG